MNFDKESKSDFFFGGGGGGGVQGKGIKERGERGRQSNNSHERHTLYNSFALNFIKIFYHYNFGFFFCLISHSKVSSGDLHINPYQTLMRDSLYCPSSTLYSQRKTSVDNN